MLENFYAFISIGQQISTIIIAAVAVFGIFNTRWIWKQTNRPVISALIETNSAGNMATTYDLSVINSGTRPAINIKLTIDNQEEFEKCVAKNTQDPLLNSIHRCFSEDGIIPLLINGKKISNSFGMTSVNNKNNIWNYGSYFSITIEYQDLEEKQYKSNLTLFIKDSKAFAGGSWSWNLD